MGSGVPVTVRVHPDGPYEPFTRRVTAYAVDRVRIESESSDGTGGETKYLVLKVDPVTNPSGKVRYMSCLVPVDGRSVVEVGGHAYTMGIGSDLQLCMDHIRTELALTGDDRFPL
jgi:hypothetical protein